MEVSDSSREVSIFFLPPTRDLELQRTGDHRQIAGCLSSVEEKTSVCHSCILSSGVEVGSSVSRCACRLSWSIARICFAAAMWIKVAVSRRDVPRGISTDWFTLCVRNCLPALIKPDLVARQCEPLHANRVSRLRARWCALRSRRNDTLTRSMHEAW